MNRRGWLLIPFLILYVGDIGWTLQGQPAAYWAGDYSQASEHNPLAFRLLVEHPASFVIVALVWAAAISVIILLWRNRLADWMAVLLALGHAVGGSTWLVRLCPGGWWWAVLYLVIASWLSGVCWRRASMRRGAGLQRANVTHT